MQTEVSFIYDGKLYVTIVGASDYLQTSGEGSNAAEEVVLMSSGGYMQAFRQLTGLRPTEVMRVNDGSTITKSGNYFLVNGTVDIDGNTFNVIVTQDAVNIERATKVVPVDPNFGVTDNVVKAGTAQDIGPVTINNNGLRKPKPFDQLQVPGVSTGPVEEAPIPVGTESVPVEPEPVEETPIPVEPEPVEETPIPVEPEVSEHSVVKVEPTVDASASVVEVHAETANVNIDTAIFDVEPDPEPGVDPMPEPEPTAPEVEPAPMPGPEPEPVAPEVEVNEEEEVKEEPIPMDDSFMNTPDQGDGVMREVDMSQGFHFGSGKKDHGTKVRGLVIGSTSGNTAGAFFGGANMYHRNSLQLQGKPAGVESVKGRTRINPTQPEQGGETLTKTEKETQSWTAPRIRVELPTKPEPVSEPEPEPIPAEVEEIEPVPVVVEEAPIVKEEHVDSYTSEQAAIDEFKEGLDEKMRTVLNDIPVACLGTISEFIMDDVDEVVVKEEGRSYCIDHRWFNCGDWYCIDSVSRGVRIFYNYKNNEIYSMTVHQCKQWLSIM